MVVQPKVAVLAITGLLEAAAEQSDEDLASRQTEPASIQESSQQIFDVLPVDLLPRDHIGSQSFLPDRVKTLP